MEEGEIGDAISGVAGRQDGDDVALPSDDEVPAAGDVLNGEEGQEGNVGGGAGDAAGGGEADAGGNDAPDDVASRGGMEQDHASDPGSEGAGGGEGSGGGGGMGVDQGQTSQDGHVGIDRSAGTTPHDAEPVSATHGDAKPDVGDDAVAGPDHEAAQEFGGGGGVSSTHEQGREAGSSEDAENDGVSSPPLGVATFLPSVVSWWLNAPRPPPGAAGAGKASNQGPAADVEQADSAGEADKRVAATRGGGDGQVEVSGEMHGSLGGQVEVPPSHRPTALGVHEGPRDGWARNMPSAVTWWLARARLPLSFASSSSLPAAVEEGANDELSEEGIAGLPLVATWHTHPASPPPRVARRSAKIKWTACPSVVTWLQPAPPRFISHPSVVSWFVGSQGRTSLAGGMLPLPKRTAINTTGALGEAHDLARLESILSSVVERAPSHYSVKHLEVEVVEAAVNRTMEEAVCVMECVDDLVLGGVRAGVRGLQEALVIEGLVDEVTRELCVEAHGNACDQRGAVLCRDAWLIDLVVGMAGEAAADVVHSLGRDAQWEAEAQRDELQDRVDELDAKIRTNR